MPPRSQDAHVPFLGWILLFVGLGWLASNLGLQPGRFLGALWPWPLILFLIGISVLLGGGERKVPRGLALIAAGALVWAGREHMLPPLPLWHLLAPILLILVGGSVVWRSFNRT